MNNLQQRGFGHTQSPETNSEYYKYWVAREQMYPKGGMSGAQNLSPALQYPLPIHSHYPTLQQGTHVCP